MQVGTILEHIDLGQMALPQFQRGYVWNREQVRGLMSSLYRRYPVGSLLVWTTTIGADALKSSTLLPASGAVDLLLDGQQRITSLYGLVRGKPPVFFEGNPQAFTGLMFNLSDETFEFYAPVKMRDNPVWIDVTKLMQSQEPTITFAKELKQIEEHGINPYMAMGRLQRVQSIKQIDFHIEQISGEDKTIDVVVEIFNRVNSGGTTLSKGDLALARICASWPEARDRLTAMLDKWKQHGYSFKLDWLLRCVTAVATGEAFFSSLAKVSTQSFAEALERTEDYIDKLLNLIGARLGLDHGDVLSGVYAFPLMTRYLHQRGGKITSSEEQGKLLYWYIHTALWGRYSGSTETKLSQDLRHIQQNDGALDRLIAQLRQNRGSLQIHPDDFYAWGRGARFYSLLYMMTRVYGAKDLETGLDLHAFLLGKLARLELHHIFPKAKLYKHNYTMSEVNSLANFMFLTQDTNLQIRDRDPWEYFEYYESTHPGVLASQWIPLNRDLWSYDQYPVFLHERRALLAHAANSFLNSLLSTSQQTVPIDTDLDLAPQSISTETENLDSTEEERILHDLQDWLSELGLPDGERYYELVNDDTGTQLAVLDIAWPGGLQEGLSQAVALLLDESHDVELAANRAGFRYFTDIDSFRDHVRNEVLSDGEAGADAAD